ncbi:hypothetical protein P875_00034094 [Aspergillus parasiticus SU-1]|uniref:Uncharacterized protein n=1 Tax=Aspergillus parasiticus (strain ATCC 56775 / NRRL 5862 / SRRC 143 / SU-1) TaxID=1403190 RepID=A0A0F0IAN8_ASPPU|nr:hypothetical protein P875_00034094 [Aspergillus parasiticus SU-1]
MSQFTFFPNMHWRNLVLNFPESDHHSLPPSSWRVTQKINENIISYTQEEAEERKQLPLACAKFECETLEDSSNKAILIVYMEIPCEDTECAAEGTYETPLCVRVEFTAHYLLTLNGCRYSPGAIQYKEETQTSGDRHAFMPGGKIYYLVIGKLPGVPLGNGLISYTEDGRISFEGLFWNLSREERDQIRLAFQDAYSYIQGPFEPLDLTDMGIPRSGQLDPYGPKVMKIWGLAIAPKGEVNYDVPIDCLEQLGWIL